MEVCGLICVSVCDTLLYLSIILFVLLALQLEIEERHLSVPLGELFPHCSEYLVRFGWMSCGKAVWIQLMDRLQHHLVIAVIDIQSFRAGYESSSAILPKIYILFEEKSSFWLPVS